MEDRGALRQRIRFCIAADGVRLAYATMGKGPPLVKAANWLTHLEHDVRSPLWRPLLERLAARRSLVRYDQRACGLSDWRVADISFEAWVSDLEAVAEATGFARFALLGISQGGAAAIAYAVRHPQRVSHLVLCGGFARGALRRDPTPEQAGAARALVQLVRFGWGGGAPSFRHVFSLQFLPHAGAEQLRQFDELQRVSASAENAARTIAAFDHIDVADLVPQVRVPTLVLHSRHDARVPFEEGRFLAATIPGAHFVPLESHNHLPLAGEPAFAEMTAAIEDFLGADSPTAAPDAYAELTRREREILHLVAQGIGNAAIAERLAINVKTVRNHLTSIFDKLGVGDRAQAIVRAREAGFGRSE
ncbi:MAG: alpha/beta fold hydrolase [Burkholderiales bacterium]|nr:alpha/beta fold hydrolase [Burkholderiales bacterium]